MAIDGREQETGLPASAPGGVRQARLKDPASWVWPVPFLTLLCVLLARNWSLFTTRLYEKGDSGANSLLIEQAKHFSLLHGNYSRQGFNHPGPGFLYLQAAGEWLFHDLLHLVPTAWNGQLLAVFLFESALIATAVWILYDWTRSLWSTAIGFAVILGFVALHPPIVNEAWMPYLYVPAYLVFILATASVAAGRTRHLWVVAFTGCLLIHGHASFLMFVPVTVVVVIAARWRSLRDGLRGNRAQWITAAVICAVFALPLVVDTALHWPGEFGKYVSYGLSSKAGGHPLGAAVHYVLFYWSPGRYRWAVAIGLAGAAAVIGLRLVRGELRRFMIAALALGGLTTLLALYYAVRGIDNLAAPYMEYFYWSVPLVMMIIIGVGVADRLRVFPVARVLLAVVVVAGAGLAASAPKMHTDLRDDEPALSAAVGDLAGLAPGRPLVLSIDSGTWSDVTGFLVLAERRGIRACVVGQKWSVLLSPGLICGPHDLATGATFRFHDNRRTPAAGGSPVIVRLDVSAVTR